MNIVFRKNASWNWLIILLLAAVLLGACQGAADQQPAAATETPQEPAPTSRPMMGPGSGMMARHHATIPAEYSGLQNPILADEASVARGSEIYAEQCATCHGDQGLGDGPAGVSLDPLPAPLAHTARMLADDYLFWRMSEGGAMTPFSSAMPSWKAALDEEARWDVINYLRVMAGGQAQPGAAGTQVEAEQRADMLARALEEGVITEEEADLFDQVHARMDTLLIDRPMGPGQDDVLAELVAEGAFTEEQIQAFNDIHDRLLASGLMSQ